jgi:2-phosphoglycolate phosphatase
MPAFKALLFDLDGTLLDTAPDFISALNLQLTMHGREPLPVSAVRTSVTNGSAGLIQDGFGITPEHADFETIRQQYLDLYFNNLADQTDLFPGMEEVLARCEHDNIPWGIVTNKPWKYSSAVLEQLHLIGRAATVICPDHVAHPKPNPEAMLLAAAQISVVPKDCLYVGDHLRDIDAGIAAGMSTIAAGWGYIEHGEDASNWNADYFVSQSNQLYQLLFNP